MHKPNDDKIVYTLLLFQSAISYFFQSHCIIHSKPVILHVAGCSANSFAFLFRFFDVFSTSFSARSHLAATIMYFFSFEMSAYNKEFYVHVVVAFSAEVVWVKISINSTIIVLNIVVHYRTFACSFEWECYNRKKGNTTSRQEKEKCVAHFCGT